METKTVHLKIYSYDQLSEQAKEKAYNDWLKGFEYHYHSDNIKSLQMFCEHFDIKCRNWEYDANYHRFDVHIEADDLAELSGLKLYSHINTLTDQLKPFKTYYSKTVGSNNNKKRTSRIIKEQYFDFTGYCADYYFMDALTDYLKKPDLKMTFQSLMENAINAFFKDCCKDCEYCQSQAYFAEESEQNDWYYFSNGEQYSEGIYEIAS